MLFREEHAAVDHEQLLAVLEDGHVPTDLSETTQRHDAQPVAGQRRQRVAALAPWSAAAHRASPAPRREWAGLVEVRCGWLTVLRWFGTLVECQPRVSRGRHRVRMPSRVAAVRCRCCRAWQHADSRRTRQGSGGKPTVVGGPLTAGARAWSPAHGSVGALRMPCPGRAHRSRPRSGRVRSLRCGCRAPVALTARVRSGRVRSLRCGCRCLGRAPFLAPHRLACLGRRHLTAKGGRNRCHHPGFSDPFPWRCAASLHTERYCPAAVLGVENSVIRTRVRV